MANLYEDYIREFLTAGNPTVRPKLHVMKSTIDLSIFGTYDKMWHLSDKDIPDGLLRKLVITSSSPDSLASFFTLDDRVDHVKAASLILLGEHYSNLPERSDSQVEFTFSPCVSAEDGTILFYAGFNRGPLWGAGFLRVCRPN